jgi:hypothetical protein
MTQFDALGHALKAKFTKPSSFVSLVHMVSSITTANNPSSKATKQCPDLLRKRQKSNHIPASPRDVPGQPSFVAQKPACGIVIGAQLNTVSGRISLAQKKIHKRRILNKTIHEKSMREKRIRSVICIARELSIYSPISGSVLNMQNAAERLSGHLDMCGEVPPENFPSIAALELA